MAKFLVIDDRVVVRNTIKKILATYGHTVAAEAENKKNAILQYKFHKPDIVTLDTTIARNSSIEIVQGILEYDKNGKILIITGETDKKILARFVKLGVQDIIIKPVVEKRLLQSVIKILS
ncbi:MAG: response regulator [Actinomycetia bacterium]|nr:response regulator [Actinomycetes bacterium]